MSRSNWRTSNRRSELPDDWKLIRRKVLERCGRRCEHVSDSGVRCRQPATDVDHRDDRDYHGTDGLQGLCPDHHKRKTAAESREARVAKRRKGARRRRDDRPGAL